jgi:Tripartite tricarboxylate transporter family receptor
VSGQPVVVDNRGGGSGNVAYQAVARANPDGYTLLNSYSAYHVGNPNLTPKLPWAQKDFVAVALITVATNVIAVHPSIPANTLGEFITYLKANPGKLSYASQGNGSLSHIGTEMFKLQTQTSMVHIPYRGSGPALQDVLSGQVQVFITTPPSVMGQVQVGKLKGLAVAGKTRHPGLPTVPTTAEAGLKGFELEAWVGIFAPAATPPDVVSKLSAQIKAALELRRRCRCGAALHGSSGARCAGEKRYRVLGKNHQDGWHQSGVIVVKGDPACRVSTPHRAHYRCGALPDSIFAHRLTSTRCGNVSAASATTSQRRLTVMSANRGPLKSSFAHNMAPSRTVIKKLVPTLISLKRGTGRFAGRLRQTRQICTGA